MLFRHDVLKRIAGGSVTLAFRRWTRPTVRPGGRLRTPAGVLAIDTVDVIAPAAITDADARRAGYDTRAAALTVLATRSGGDIYRIAFRFVGPDPRTALRQDDTLDGAALDGIVERLDRLDRASPTGLWTRATIDLIASHPRRRAGDLAALLGLDRLAFKRNVRKLKELGLIESLAVGYRLSPRGAAAHRRVRRG